MVADVRLHRDGVAALLRLDRRIRITATVDASDPACIEADIDVIVLDTAGDEGLRLVRRWGVAGIPVVAIGIPRAEEHVLAFAETGVLGFVEREAGVDVLADSIRAAARGEASCPPRVATTLLRRIATSRLRSPATSANAARLTAREQQIVELIAEGLSNKEIGSRLYIEVATVKNHVHNILEKLQVSRRSEAVACLRLVPGTEYLRDTQVRAVSVSHAE